MNNVTLWEKGKQARTLSKEKVTDFNGEFDGINGTHIFCNFWLSSEKEVNDAIELLNDLKTNIS